MTVHEPFAARGEVDAKEISRKTPTGAGPDVAPQNVSSGRIQGLDIARGFALIGMITVHSIPPVNNTTETPSLLHLLFSGHSAALFALLAGVGLALITGGSVPYTGVRKRRAQVAIAVRALLLLTIGLALNYVLPVFHSILPYYAVYFLGGLLLTGMGVRTLFGCAAFTALVGPVVIYLVAWWDPLPVIATPTLTDLVSEPLATAVSLLVTGTYPAVTWLTFLSLGVAVGRLDLNRLSVQIQLLTWGAITALVSSLSAEIIVHQLGGFELLLATTEVTAEEVGEHLVEGGQVPTSSWLWLITNAPHSNTTFDLLESAGLAVFAVGACLLIHRVLGRRLAVFGAVGSMTLTLYSAHLVLITVVDVPWWPIFWTLAQVIGAVVFALVWRALVGKGPLEAVVAWTAKTVARLLVPGKPDARDSGVQQHQPGDGPGE
ncbi:MAG TPA: heparan-alpha-glucosaminide N-acetyltransferase domain-containing protein [Corynebacterium sp.]|nr:heparan-alpha-glucosaminide N-acetyltransferase domain-containing protein [Corynebacterium sp.]